MSTRADFSWLLRLTTILTSAPAAAFGCGDADESPSVAQIAPGSRHTCAVMRDRTVSCWGFRGAGALADGAPVGPGTSDFQLTPVATQGVGAVDQIAVGSYSTCALADGGVKCWGAPIGKLFADPDENDLTLAPTAVSRLESEVSAISVGSEFACALKVDGSIWCWGHDPSVPASDQGGQLQPADVPTEVRLPGRATSLAVGDPRACAALESGGVWCWERALENTSTETVEQWSVPTEVTWLRPVQVQRVETGYYESCALTSSGEVICWDQGGSTRWIELDASIKEISMGRAHSCALSEAGEVWCWGQGWGGQRGDGLASRHLCATAAYQCYTDTPVRALGLEKVKLIGAGGDTSCAVTAEATYCWGENLAGQVGSGDRWDTFLPVRVEGL